LHGIGADDRYGKRQGARNPLLFILGTVSGTPGDSGWSGGNGTHRGFISPFPIELHGPGAEKPEFLNRTGPVYQQPSEEIKNDEMQRQRENESEKTAVHRIPCMITVLRETGERVPDPDGCWSELGLKKTL
jgi:hypothetical protein